MTDFTNRPGKSQFVKPLAAVTAIGLLAACGGGNADDDNSSPATSDKLVIADQATPVALDPTNYTGEPHLEAIYNTYDTLLQYTSTEVVDNVQGDNFKADLDESLEGLLAESWEQLDPTTLRFTLREGVTSPAGNELTASDVVYTVERHFELDLVGSQTLNQGRIEGATEVDEYTVDINTAGPSRVAPFIAAQPQGLGILDSTEVQAHATDDDPWAQDWLKLNSAGFGPYQLTEATPGQKFVYGVNPNYFGDEPHFTTVEWQEVPSPSDRTSLLQAGDVDIVHTLPPQIRQRLADTDQVDVVDVGEEWSVLTVGLTPNVRTGPLEDPTVRQAIAHLIPNEQLINDVMNGEGDVRRSWIASAFLPDMAGDFWDYEEDVDKAQELLDEAGYGDGFTTSITFDSSQSTHEEIGSLLVPALARAGISVSLDKLSSTAYSEALASRDFELLMTYGGPLVPNGAYELHLWYNSGNFINSGGYVNEDIDALIDEAIAAESQDDYLDALHQADEILAEDVPRIGLINTGDHYQFSSDLTGFYWKANTGHYQWSRLSDDTE